LPYAWEFSVVKKKRGRVIYLDAFMKALTVKLIERYGEGTLLRNRRGQPWVSGTAGQRFSEIIRTLIQKKPDLGLTKRHTPYACRHTWITRALDNGDLSIQDVAEMAGTSVRQIERTYKTVGRRHKKLANLADKVHGNSQNIE
jgi:integrase